MNRTFLAVLTAVLLADQAVKAGFIAGWGWDSPCVSLVLTYNKGVAFSLLSFLGDSLKYLQLLLIGAIAYAATKEGYIRSLPVASGLLLGAGLSNLLDRFTREGVVDYVYWHCGFRFAVFNLADVLIDLAVVIFLYRSMFNGKLRNIVT